MQIKTSTVSLLIYTGMAVLAAGLVMRLIKKSRWSIAAGWAATAILAAAWVMRWKAVGHIPMQNMFEVFLTLGAFLAPIGIGARRFTGIDNEPDRVGDLIWGLIILFAAGFVFTDQPQKLPPALQSPLFGPHVAVYMLAYVLMAKAAVQAATGIIQQKAANLYETSAYLYVCMGFPFLSLGLLLGSVWGKLAWGDWWGWDPKELWSLACWLMYVFYFHWRYLFGQKLLRSNCVWILLGFVFIIITLLWVNLSRIFAGMHNYA